MISVENRLKPRLQVLKILEDLNLIEKWPGIWNVYLATDDLFAKKFLAPNLNALGDAHFPVNKLLKQGPSSNIAAVQS
ncbi:hypothetical protein Leryth_020661 [Lithospermum erythrorhizon]|nr:hypothetical protein Leryth_020661 [Lithospermum erythrorhizon]